MVISEIPSTYSNFITDWLKKKMDKYLNSTPFERQQLNLRGIDWTFEFIIPKNNFIYRESKIGKNGFL